LVGAPGVGHAFGTRRPGNATQSEARKFPPPLSRNPSALSPKWPIWDCRKNGAGARERFTSPAGPGLGPLGPLPPGNCITQFRVPRSCHHPSGKNACSHLPPDGGGPVDCGDQVKRRVPCRGSVFCRWTRGPVGPVEKTLPNTIDGKGPPTKPGGFECLHWRGSPGLVGPTRSPPLLLFFPVEG